MGRDPTDIPVLGTAVAGECALLISVDRDLLDIQNVHKSDYSSG
jgi:predicted nucleic acid-binding protein